MEEIKAFRQPKNIRQIGHVEGPKNIYIEDYVMTYAGKISGMAILLGQVMSNGTETCFYISGAVQVRDTVDGYPIVLSKEEWSVVYEDIRRYFPDYEMLGWLMIQNEQAPEIDEDLRRIHEENFPGINKILFLYDRQEKEEAFYISDNQFMLRRQNGYYIYFEKNEPMQTYMVDQNGGGPGDNTVVEEEDPMEKVRQIIAEKETPPAEKKTMRLMYGASTVLAAVVLIIGATMLDNYDKMRNMEKALNVISNSMEQTQQVGEQSINVEKVGGNISSQKTEGSGEEEKTLTGQKDNSAGEGEVGEPADGGGGTNGSGGDTDQGTDDSLGGGASDEGAVDKGGQKTGEGTKSGQEGGSKETMSQGKTKSYVVQKGDTLASISLQFYKSYQYVDKIKKLNSIDDNDRIIEGQTLLLP